MLTAVTGIKWGDEGKGRVIDLLAERADIVVRYQGGNNANHVSWRSPPRLPSGRSPECSRVQCGVCSCGWYGS